MTGDVCRMRLYMAYAVCGDMRPLRPFATSATQLDLAGPSVGTRLVLTVAIILATQLAVVRRCQAGLDWVRRFFTDFPAKYRDRKDTK